MMTLTETSLQGQCWQVTVTQPGVGELANVGVRNPGPRAVDMLSIGRPDLDWVSLARGMGVEASRAKTCDQLVKALGAGLRSEGPYLIEVAL